jgi:outer membrane protein assembly factor BamB
MEYSREFMEKAIAAYNLIYEKYPESKFAGEALYDEAKIFGDLVCFGCRDCNYYALDRTTGKEVWRFQSSNQQISSAPPIQDEYSFVIKKSTHIEDAVSEDKYRKKKTDEVVSLSDYHVASEYATTSEYKQKSDYDTSLVMFEEMAGETLEPHFLNKTPNLVLWTSRGS